MAFNYVELFAGIGGFRLGLDSAGGTHLFANERDEKAAATYSAWFGEENLNIGDIFSLNYKRDIPKHDLLCGGFPCQPFSIAGVSKKNSLGKKHGFKDSEQGNLFFEICKIAEIHKPKVIFLENVKNLLSHNKGKTWETIKTNIENLGYFVHYQVISAEAWVPQKRKRIFIVALNKKYFSKLVIESFKFPEPPTQNITLKSVLQKNPPDQKYMLSDNLWRYLKKYAAKHKAIGNGFGFKLYDENDIAGTLSARYYKDGAEILIKQPGWKNPRKLTPKEAARLMGFNSRYARMLGYQKEFPIVVSDTQAYKQFGNAVCPPIIESIAEEIHRIMKIQDHINSRESANDQQIAV